MSAMAFLCRGGRSIGNIFDALYSRAKACSSVSIGFHNGRLGDPGMKGTFASRVSGSADMYKVSIGRGPITAYALLSLIPCRTLFVSPGMEVDNESEKAEKQDLKLGRIRKEGSLLFSGNKDYLLKHNGPLGGRAYIHTKRKRYIRPRFTQKLNPGDVKTKLELKLTNTVKGFQIYYMAPAEIKGEGKRKRLARLYSKPYRFDDDWLPYVELMVKNQSPELRSLMDKYWLEPADHGAEHDLLRSFVMMYRGVQNYRILFTNYWEETVYTALPFLEEGREHYLGKILKDFHRGEFYKGIDFVEGLSRIVGADVAVEFEENDDSGHKEAVAVMLLLDEEKNPINHPECGIKCPRTFLFSGASMY